MLSRPSRLRQSLLGAALGFALLAAPLAARAQFIEGPYIAGGAGFNLLPNTGLGLDSAAVNGLAAAGVGNQGTVGFQPGFATVLSLGWGFGNGLRAEIEGNYRTNDTDGGTGVAGWYADGGTSGRQESWGLMGNLMLDLVRIGGVTPYIGVGAGYMVTDWGVRGYSQNRALRMTVNDSDGQFAYQGIAGLAFPLDILPGLAITAEYRFVGTLQPRLQVRFDNPTTGATVARGTIEPDAYQQSLMLGLRYAFNAPAAPAPAPPAAAPAQTRSFIVFFDWNSASLTERARQIIAEAAQQARAQGSTTRIEVAGHADRTGTVQYNQALSRRRAEIVAAELVRLGVAREEISITALGESQPLVPTPDNVREPQNRRVEIILR